MELKRCLWYIGVLLLVGGASSLLPLFIALFYHEPAVPFLVGPLLALSVGLVFTRFPRKRIDFGDVMIIVGVGFIMISLFDAVTFYMLFGGGSAEVFVDCYFESVSGYSTTGLTVLPVEMLDPESGQYLYSLIFKRTFSEWIGGLGMVIIFLSILVGGGISTVYLYRMEHGTNRITPSIKHTARIILRVYLFYTVCGAILLCILGNMDPFYALTGVMSNISTGGFIGVVFRGSGFEISWMGECVLMAAMILGAVPFIMHNDLLSGRLRRFLGNIEIKAFFLILSLSVLLFIWLLWDCGFYDTHEGVVYNSVLGTISALTTTGYSGGGLESTGDAGRLVLVVLMVIGAGAGSTGGGMKLIRFCVLIGGVRWLLKKYSLPESAVVPFRVGGRIFQDNEVRTIALFFFIYMLLLGVGCFVLMLYGMGATDAFFVSVSAQGTNGITTVDLRDLPAVPKVMLIIQMITGRLEIFPLLVLIGYFVHRVEREVIVAEHKAEGKMKLRGRGGD